MTLWGVPLALVLCQASLGAFLYYMGKQAEGLRHDYGGTRAVTSLGTYAIVGRLFWFGLVIYFGVTAGWGFAAKFVLLSFAFSLVIQLALGFLSHNWAYIVLAGYLVVPALMLILVVLARGVST